MNTNQLTTNSIFQTILKNIVGNDSSWFWTMIQAIGVVLTLLLIVRQLKLQRLTNVLSSLTALSTRWDGLEMVQARRNICQDYLDGKACGIQSTIAVAGFFEEVGVYAVRQIVEADIVWELYGEYIEHYWPILLTRVKEAEEWDDSAFSNFRALHGKCAALSAKADPKTEQRSQHDLEEFANSELAKK